MSYHATITNSSGDSVTVSDTASAKFVVKAYDDAEQNYAPAYVANTDAPALALAILEAAGYAGRTGETYICAAVDSLHYHIEEQAEAKEQKALDREAEALYAAYATAASYTPRNWAVEGFSEDLKDRWRALARKAREIHSKESK